MLWQILVEFLFRLAGGLAIGLLLTSSRWVSAGFFRVQLWIVLGLNTLTAALAVLLPEFPQRHWIAVVASSAAMLSYVGAVLWLYEKVAPGRIVLLFIVLLNLSGAMSVSAGAAGAIDRSAVDPFPWSQIPETLTATLLLGSTLTAMLLGHWYLNTPSMQLLPLQRLVVWMAIAVVARSAVALGGLWNIDDLMAAGRSTLLAFMALRWLAGLLGVLGLTGMTWQTLKIPNTQSATGILYVAVILVFLGELTSQLLAAEPPQ